MSKVGKGELIDLVSEATGESKAAVKRVLEAVTETVEVSLAAGKTVALTGFGTFERRHRAKRNGVNPSNGEKITIAASNYPAFKPAKAFKDAIDKSPF